MNRKVFEFKKKKDGKEMGTKRLIAPDLPFDYEELVEATSEQYVRNLNRDGMSFLSHEEIKRNIDIFLFRSLKKPEYTNVSGYQVADDYYYHSGHSWVHMKLDGSVRIGIDDFTARVFGPVDTINLPSVGDFLKQGEVGWELNRNDHKAPMASPVSGTVMAVNNNVGKRPEITHDDPYDAGCLLLLDPSNLELDMKKLYMGKECFQWMEKENQILLELLGPRYERLAATGASPVNDIFGNFPEIAWDQLVKIFLRTKKT